MYTTKSLSIDEIFYQLILIIFTRKFKRDRTNPFSLYVYNFTHQTGPKKALKKQGFGAVSKQHPIIDRQNQIGLKIDLVTY